MRIAPSQSRGKLHGSRLVACQEFVSGIATQGDYRVVYFIRSPRERKREIGVRSSRPKMQIPRLQGRLRDQRTTWIRLRA